jgi:hypothetical protein
MVVDPFLIMVAALCIPSIVVFSCFDSIVRFQYEFRPTDWAADGRPRGYAWKPPVRTNPFAGSVSREVVLSRWLRRKPDWAIGTAVEGRFQHLRMSVAVWIIAVVTALLWAVTSARP